MRVVLGGAREVAAPVVARVQRLVWGCGTVGGRICTPAVAKTAATARGRPYLAVLGRRRATGLGVVNVITPAELSNDTGGLDRCTSTGAIMGLLAALLSNLIVLSCTPDLNLPRFAEEVG